MGGFDGKRGETGEKRNESLTVEEESTISPS
jgi:hypothetical protein